TTTMEILSIKLPERMNNSNYHYYYIVGVHGGEIAVRRETRTRVGEKEKETYEICKAKFPEALKQLEEAIPEIREKREKEEEEKKKRRERNGSRRYKEL
ncbi:hypothetical protein PFISCL1PPCAC_17010, partial [Pristionchus fissidentatus]